jgi:ketosteroid isomerase-like protein
MIAGYGGKGGILRWLV